MALHQFLFGSTLMIILSLSGGCDSQLACGRAVRNTRIVGGQNVSPGSWPWQAILVRDGRSFCSGSLIQQQWVLTAAHCVIRADLFSVTVFLGRNSQSGPNPNEVSRGLDRIRCHHAYNSLFNENDICLLKLSAPVTFTDYIQPVCLASASSIFHTGVSSWVAGFGLTQEGSFLRPEILQEVNIPVVGNNECRCAYPRLTENMMCAGLRAGGKDACVGDSGAPLVTKKQDVWIQTGIVSFGDGCARPNTPGGYARVSRYEQWITDITGSSQPGFVTYMSSGVDSDANFDCSSITDPVTGTTTTAMMTTTTMTTTMTTTLTPTTTTTMPTTTTTPPTTTTTTPTTTTTTPTTTTTTPTTTTTTPTTTTTTPTTTTTTTPTTTTTTPTTTTTTPTTTTTTTTTTPTTTTTTPTTTTTTPTTTTTTPTTTTITPTTTTTTSTTTTTTTPTTTTTTSMITIIVKTSDGDSVFDSGERVIHFSHLTSLCLLIISLFVLGGDT